MSRLLTRALLALNALGLLLYLYWLATGSEHLFRTADGVVQLLPCLFFLFVFIYLRPRPTLDGADEE